VLREPGVAGRPGGSEQEVGRVKIARAFSGLAPAPLVAR